MKILVIDDDDLVRRMVTKVLRADGHDVVTAADGLRGMDMVHKERPQIVITDIFMPEQEGIETILAIRRENPGIKIVAMSGAGEIGGNDLLKMALLLGADDSIPKPFRAHDLLARIRALGGNLQAADSLSA
jgi:DNA-binding response OmpR family regulator